jgi:hypothetical protein
MPGVIWFIGIFLAFTLCALVALSQAQKIALKIADKLGVVSETLLMERVAIYIKFNQKTQEESESFEVEWVDRFYPKDGLPKYDPANFPKLFYNQKQLLEHLINESGSANIYIHQYAKEELDNGTLKAIQNLETRDLKLNYRYFFGIESLQLVEGNTIYSVVVFLLGFFLSIAFLLPLIKTRYIEWASNTVVLGMVISVLALGTTYRLMGNVYPNQYDFKRYRFTLERPGIEIRENYLLN